jgi:hypothetical protein
MDLQRIKHLAGIKLNENVMAVPGVGQRHAPQQSALDSDLEDLDNIKSEVAKLMGHPIGGKIAKAFLPKLVSELSGRGFGSPGVIAKALSTFGLVEDGEAAMQTAGTIGRGNAAAAFDAAQTPATESMEMDEKAPPGMEDMVMKLKKEYPGDESKAFATAWSIYNKKHGKTEESMDESEYGGFSNKPPSSRDAQAMQQRFNDEKWKRHAEDDARLKQQSPQKPKEEGCIMEENTERSEEIGRAVEHFVNMVTHSFADPETAYDRIIYDMDDETRQEFNDALEAEGLMSQSDEDSFDDSMDGDFDSAMASAGHGSDEDYGHFGGEEFEEGMEDGDQWDEPEDPREVCPSCMGGGTTGRGLLTRTCDTCHGSGHAGEESDEENFVIPDDDIEVHPHFDGMEESYDMNNGYNDIHDAHGDDYFPDGADSPVVKDAGPSGARQGDNPEQKKMQVDEVHKELVYGYRDYLKESKKLK